MMVIRHICSTLILAGASLALATPVSAETSVADRTFTHTLDNGMKIIVREDHRAPVMVSQVWYRVGSSYEHAGVTGVSHVLEHLMFKGTDKVPSGEFSKLIARYGGSENAFTSYDYTGYYQVMSATNLPLSIELEADRMQNAIMPDEEFAKEIEVVKEERRLRTDDKPNSVAYERFMAAAYLSSGYHNPVIGWMHDLDNMTGQDARNWYRQWYVPNNAILVVVGDVNAKEVFGLASRYFGPIPAGDLPKRPLNKEVAGKGERRIEVAIPAKVPTLYVGYNVPGINTATDATDVYALRMLAGVLDGGYSARIETEMVRNQGIAASAGAGYGGFALGDTLFYFSGVPSEGYSVEQLEEAFEQQIERLQTELADPAELERVKAQIISGIIYQQDSISSQANQIGRMEAIGRSWREADTMVDKLSAITPQQIQAAARKYLIPDNKTVAILKPQPL
ncbi:MULTISPECIES: M16 family metallopeptidase [unclassified Ketobacter]|uniref:M16 family metallopeptidase n=1 Tax=unclassified Ketobacter TaxID=2639109 RepID=UPI000F18F019|nr:MULTISPECIES: pitrilysin family protein [unclassified Ketobacter]RLT90916.1 MAG: insulinase family protein [Ketobacter sp. GenoA1]RLT94609.1 MAG: insulinase family protein [Ketobacter sp.]